MAGIGVLVDDGSNKGYAYKILAPIGSIFNSILDLSNIFNPKALPLSPINMADGILMVHNGEVVMVSIDALRDKVINEYIVTMYPSSTVFVGTNPVYSGDNLLIGEV